MKSSALAMLAFAALPSLVGANPAPLVVPPRFEAWAPAQPAGTSGTRLYAAYRRPAGGGVELLSLTGKRLPLDVDLKTFVRGQVLAQTQTLPSVRYLKSCGKTLALLAYDEDFGSGRVAAMRQATVVVSHVAYVAAYSHAKTTPDAKDAMRAIEHLCLTRPPD